MPRLPIWFIAAPVIAVAFVGWGIKRSRVPKETVGIIAPHPGAPKALRVMLNTAQGGYSADFETMSLTSSQPEMRPAIIWLSGCGFAEMARDTPKRAAIFSVDESRGGTIASVGEACEHHDATELETAIRSELSFALSATRQIDWLDPKRLVIVASGDAVPVVASAHVPEASAKVLLADPCLVPWSTIDNVTPTYVLRTAKPSGMEYTQRSGTLDLARSQLISGGNNPSSSRIASTIFNQCTAQPRPALPPAFVVNEVNGEPITTTDRPKTLWKSQIDIFKALWPDEALSPDY